MNRRLVTASVSAVLVCLAAACSTEAPSSSEDVGKDGVKMGVGVTDSTIKLAAVSDLSGVFAIGGSALAHAQDVYFDKVNAEGGICGREVEFEILDGGYDVQKSVTEYAAVREEVLGFPAFVGSAAIVALYDKLDADQVLLQAPTWTSSLLENEQIMMPGPTYEYAAINGLEWLRENEMIKSGSKVGLLRTEGPPGESLLAGAQYLADEVGFTIVDQEVGTTATDMSGAVAKFKSENVDAILMNATPAITSSVAASAQAANFDRPLMAATPGAFNPGLLDTPVADYLEENLHLALSWNMSDEDGDVAKLVEDFEVKYPDDVVNENAMWGFGAAAAYTDILRQACEDDDLTRAGVMEAFRAADSVDSLGILPELDYTEVGESPSRMHFIYKVNAESLAAEEVQTPGGYVSEAAENFELSD